MSDEKSTETQAQAIQIGDFVATPIELNAERMRQIISGLRQLPNVSDMAVITAIAEFNRIATIIEETEQKRQRIIKAAIDAAKGNAPQVIESIKRGEAIESAVMRPLIEQIFADVPVHPTCGCPRCTAAREKAAIEGSSTSRH